ncbi:MAG: type II toxin-antitoxin system VapC family toxin [Anaerolineae bacterium]
MSALVADTHSIIWYLREPSRLSKSALAAMRRATQAGDPIFISAISLVEVVYLVEKGRLPQEALDRLLDALDGSTSLGLIPLDSQVATTLRQIPREQVPDMPDRIIAATALAFNLPLVTADRKISAANVRIIW